MHFLWKNWALGLCMVVILSCSDSFATNSFQAYQKKLIHLQQLHKKIAKQNQEITQVQQSLNQKGDDISAAKRKHAGSFFQGMGLQKKMQDAQELSVKLDQLYKQRSKTNDQLNFYQKQVLRSIEMDLSKAHLHTREHTQSLMNLHDQVSKLDLKQNPSPITSLPTGVIASQDTSSLEQWIVLQDLQLYTKGLITQAQQELAYEKQQTLLKKELSHLMNEEMFFGEQGFIQGTARKQNTSPTNAISKTGGQGDGSQTPSDETEKPQDMPANPQDLPETNPDAPTETEVDPSEIEHNQTQSPSIGFDEIDPQIQSTIMENAYSNNTLQEPIKADITPEVIFQTETRDPFIDNPNEITQAIMSLVPQQGESKEAFLHRKISYLHEILRKLQGGSQKAKNAIESVIDEK